MLKKWLETEKKGFIGWDFTEINEQTKSESLPWSYEKMAKALIKKDLKVLDMGTGGGEMLLSLKPYPDQTFATEMYAPNFEYAKEKLLTHGIHLFFVERDDALPFEDSTFDVILNRHESYDSKEVYRILKQGGIFLTQQVGEENSRALSTWLLGEERPKEGWILSKARQALENEGFSIETSNEYYPEMKFYDVNTFVYFAKIIEWEFPGFSVETHYEKLLQLQKNIEEEGFFKLIEHRFLLKARK